MTITIPPEALEAAARASYEAFHKIKSYEPPFDELSNYAKSVEIEAARAAALVLLENWPGVRMMVDIDTGDDAAIKLPLPQEPTDDK